MTNSTPYSSNIFGNLPDSLNDEIFESILKSDTCKVERIISKGHSTPADQWYDQDKNEWVMVLRGSAQLRFADSETPIEMKSGDYLTIPAHCRHRVEWTDPDDTTIWLAVFY
jgi:cupin 2 domain-containing protein